MPEIHFVGEFEMPLDSIFCINYGAQTTLINLNSLGVRKLKRSEFYEILSDLRENKDNSIKDFINEAPFIKTMAPSSSLFSINPLIAISFDCNYRCEYCYQGARRTDNSQLMVSDLNKIDEFYDEYCDHYNLPKRYEVFTIIGGEPLLPQNRLVLEHIFRKWEDKEFAITTNGTYIEEFFDLLEKYQIKLKVSIDGTRQMHYERRHTSDRLAYEKTILGIKKLVNAKIPVIINTVYNPLNYLKYPEFFNEMESYGWLSTPYLKLAFIPEVGKGCDDIEFDYLQLANSTFAKLKELDNRAEYVIAKGMVPGASALTASLSEAEKNKTFYPYRCSLLELPNYSFLPNGDVMLCLAIENSVGCIGKYKEQIEIDFEKIDQLKLRRFDKMKKCMNCNVKILCKGGCAATAAELSEDLIDPYCGIWEHPDFIQYIENVIS